VTKARAGQLWGRASRPRTARELGGNTPRPPLAPAAPKGGDLSVPPSPSVPPLYHTLIPTEPEIKKGRKVHTVRFDEAGQAAGITRPLRPARTEKAPRRSSPERLSKGDIDSDAAWQAYAMFVLRTGGRVPLIRDHVARRIAWTLALRRGLVLRAVQASAPRAD
jgi:hypothetical protein